MSAETKSKVMGCLPDDTPPLGAMLSLGFQQFLTMFPATVLVAILTRFDVGITLLASGPGTINTLPVSQSPKSTGRNRDVVQWGLDAADAPDPFLLPVSPGTFIQTTPPCLNSPA